MNAPTPSIESWFERLVPLNSLRPETRADLVRNARVLLRQPGEFLFRVNESVDTALYLVEGEVELRDDQDRVITRLNAGSDEARYRLAHQSPRKISALCRTPVRCLAVDSHLLDVMLTWDQTDALEVGEVGLAGSSTGAESDDWMLRLLQMRSFQMVPPANLQAIFLRMQRVNCNAGETIIRQGDAGDYFYVLTEGRCVVTREQPGQKAVWLAEFEPGACFGEEALISDSPRNATVTMLTPGSLMRLAKDDFRTLLNEPVSRRLSHAEATRLVDRGEARYLDVRLPSEFMSSSLPGSVNLPLYMLRQRVSQLDAARTYVCVCDTARRSSVASFILTQKGFDAYILQDGLIGRD